MPQEGKTDGVVPVADGVATWLAGLLAGADRETLTTCVLNSDHEHAIRQAVTPAIQLTVAQLPSSGGEQDERLAMQVSEVFCGPPGAALAGQETLLQARRAGIAAQLAVLDDADPADTGQSSAEVRGVPGQILAEAPTGHLVQAMMLRGSGGGPLAELAGQLHHDVTQLQGQRIEGALPNRGTRCRR